MNELSDNDRPEEPREHELADLQLDEDSDTEPLDLGVPESGGGRRPGLWIAVVLLVLAAAALFWWLNRPEPPAPVEPAPTTTPPPRPPAEPAPETEEPIELPPLEASDELVRERVEGLSSSPRLESWLAADGLVRRFVASIANISEGVSPRSHLDMMAPAEPFSVRREPGSIVPSAKSYSRYDAIANAIASLDAERTVGLYRRLEPLLGEAFEELGYPGRDFDEVLLSALDHLLATPVLESEPELVESVRAYEFADPELEALSGTQKQLLRTGPENMRKIRATLLELRNELER